MADQQTVDQEVKNNAGLEIGIGKGDKAVFPTMGHVKVTSSTEMIKWFKPLFSVFEDFAGFRSNWNTQTNQFYLSACFIQGDYAPDACVAFRPNVVKGSKSSGWARVNSFNRATREGNRYHLQDEVRDAIGKYIGMLGRNRDRSINWENRNIVSQICDNPNTMNPRTYNLINFIDPILLLKEIFGSEVSMNTGTDAEGNAIFEDHAVEYGIIVTGPLELNSQFPQQIQITNTPIVNIPVKLQITQVDGKELEDSAAAIGMQYTSTLYIC